MKVNQMRKVEYFNQKTSIFRDIDKNINECEIIEVDGQDDDYVNRGIHYYDGKLLYDNEKTSVLYAKYGKRKKTYVVYCKYCKRLHYHSPFDGHRIAHCSDRHTARGLIRTDSPYINCESALGGRGYIVVFDPIRHNKKRDLQRK